MELHLQQYDIPALETEPALAQCIVDFMNAYKEKLWPGKEGMRSHLRCPGSKNTGGSGQLKKAERSFYAVIDGTMSKSQRPRFEKQRGRFPNKAGQAMKSRIFKALRAYVKVLLGKPLGGDGSGDAKRLVADIVGSNVDAEQSQESSNVGGGHENDEAIE